MASQVSFKRLFFFFPDSHSPDLICRPGIILDSIEQERLKQRDLEKGSNYSLITACPGITHYYQKHSNTLNISIH